MFPFEDIVSPSIRLSPISVLLLIILSESVFPEPISDNSIPSCWLLENVLLEIARSLMSPTINKPVLLFEKLLFEIDCPLILSSPIFPTSI